MAGGNEPASYSWSIGSGWAAGVMGAWRGASSSPIDDAAGSTAAGSGPVSVSAPSLTPSGSNELQVYFYGSQAYAGPTITLPAAIEQRFDLKSLKEGFSLAFGDMAALANNARATFIATASIAGAAAMTGQAVLLVSCSTKRDSDPDCYNGADYDTAGSDCGRNTGADSNYRQTPRQLRPTPTPAPRRHYLRRHGCAGRFIARRYGP